MSRFEFEEALDNGQVKDYKGVLGGGYAPSMLIVAFFY